ncbi:DUF4440 domain-containing protein [Ahniella affigens]|uniref:DUF4440 domain-containing protein n=1 Tax=Ahniella affigens TaxID=2021234 RepID=A0A2P1PWK4_9GAMM|nr:DUF4440 domain-containing protein [Ahniella affigens]AVP99212.1 DUF4440 domain-containing protein [Ahniella affigens]
MTLKFFAGLLAFAALTGCASHHSHESPPADGSNERCVPVTKQQIADLFVRWNNSLKTGDPKKVLANYAPKSILLPTVSKLPRIEPEEKEAYFKKFLAHRPSGEVTLSFIDIGCNYAIDAGLYTFTYQVPPKIIPARYSYSYRYIDGTWLITSHHSSVLPDEE